MAGKRSRSKKEREQARRRKLGLDGAGRMGVELFATLVDDPSGGKIGVMKNRRADPVEMLLSRKVINKVQAEAAERAMNIMERMEIGGVGAIDYSRTRVDGGTPGDPITDQVLDAAQGMRVIDWKCGPTGSTILYMALCRGLTASEIAVIMIDGTRSAVGYVTYRIREALDGLVDHWRLNEAKGQHHTKMRSSQDIVSGPSKEWAPDPRTGLMVDISPLRS